MFSIRFWRSWPTVYQRFFWLLAGVLVLSVILLWVSDFYSPAPVLTPRHVHRLESVEFTSHSFHVGTIELSIPAEAYLIFERTIGDTMKTNVIGSYIFLSILMFGAAFILAIITTLRSIWFYVGMTLFVLLIISLRLDAVAAFGLTNQLPVAVVLLAFGLPVYYFRFIQPDQSLTRRFLTFTALSIGIGATIFFSAKVVQPFLHLSANAMIAGSVLTLVFIFAVAHEILAALVVVISRGTRQTKSLQHFLIISAIYLVNLGILYANRKHLIQWNFLPINLFLFITVSGILGVWGIRQRQPAYEEIIEVDPFGVLFYLALAAIGFGTIGYSVAASNDPVIQLMQDAILYSHIGYGLIFVLYVVSNFGSMLANNLQVYRVLYKPNNMPYFTFRLAGLIATFTFFAYSNWKISLDQVYAGYYNAQGDVYLADDTSKIAEGYYKRSTLYALRNYHAHYAIAKIRASEGEGGKERKEYQLLVDSRPIDLAYLNLSETYSRDNALSESKNVLKQGLHDFPNNSWLENELGLVYSQMNERDSAWRMVHLATSSSVTRKSTETNLMGLSAKFKLHLPVDSLLTSWGPETPGLKANGLALACVQGKTIHMNVDPGTDSVPSIYTILSLHNYLCSPQDAPDTALISKTIQLARKNPDPLYVDFLLSAAAYASYDNGQILQAIKLLRELAYAEQDGKYYDVLGLWALEQHAPDRAVVYFDEALNHDNKASYFNRAIGLTESSDVTGALKAWDSLARSSDSNLQTTIRKMISVLRATPGQVPQLTDEEKYLYARYRITLDNTLEFDKVTSSIHDPELKVRAIVDRCKRFDKLDEFDLAWRTLALTRGTILTDKDLYEEIAQLNLLFIARQKNWALLEQKMHSGVTFTGKYKLNKIYLDALLGAQAGKKEEAKKKFTLLANANPFFEDAIVASVDFLHANSPDTLAVYSTLVNALEQNPNSVKLLKAYIVMSAELQFEENAQQYLDKLKALMSPSSYRQFVQNN